MIETSFGDVSDVISDEKACNEIGGKVAVRWASPANVWVFHTGFCGGGAHRHQGNFPKSAKG
jgi:hypothetical protein